MKKSEKADENQPSEAILESHISLYLDKVGFVLFWILFAVTITEIAVCILIKMGYFPYFLQFNSFEDLTHYKFVEIAAINIMLTWIFYIIYLIAFQKLDFRRRKVLICIIVMILTSLVCFGHWQYGYLSILYSLPIVFTAPLGKKNHTAVFSISVVISIFYSVFQYLCFKTDYNFLICTVTLITLTALYLISRYFYLAMLKSLTDLEKYFILTNQLHHEISHDFVTGAFSKQKLIQDYKELHNLKSIAFIDLDNFKDINDTNGHDTGDKILKIFTKSFIVRNINIYRYGGDEFVVLAETSPKDLARKMGQIKSEFSNIAIKLFSCNSSFSAGIIHIDKNNTIEHHLKKCDKLMYDAKKQGKNLISVEKNRNLSEQPQTDSLL